MVARNFSFQDKSYSRLLQVPDDREFLNLEELKPHQLIELGISTEQLPQNQSEPSKLAMTASSSNEPPQQEYRSTERIYYDLSAPSQIDEGNCSIFIGEIQNPCSNDDSTKNSPLDDDTKYQCQSMQPPSYSPSRIGGSRKRKSFNTDASDFEDDTSDDARSLRTNDDSKRQNHSEIEKRRRDKMNTYITELSTMIPMCNSKSKKLDKLTVLRMAVQHLKCIRGAVHSYTEGHYKPSFLTDQELKMLILEAVEGFLFVVGCDRGRILYVSESVSQVLQYKQDDLLGQNWFDILHPKDVAKVKEQLSSADSGPRERLIDSKTMLPVHTSDSQGLDRLCPGARRSFFCRMKCKSAIQIKVEDDVPKELNRPRRKQVGNKKYCVIQCTGYLKLWTPVKTSIEDQQETDGENDSCNVSCLVAIGRVPPNIFPQSNPTTNVYQPNTSAIQFNSRHALDGKFVFVDQRATLVLGFLPQELLGTSMYEYYQCDDIPAMAESHKTALQSTTKITTSIYRFRTKSDGFVKLQSEWKSFKNPWTNDVEYMIAKNIVILSESRDENNYDNDVNQLQIPENLNFFNHSNRREIHQLINVQVEASKIGRKVAEQVFDFQRKMDDSSPDNNSLDPTDDKLTGGNAQYVSGGENTVGSPYCKFSNSPCSQRGENGASTSTGKSFRSSTVASPDQGSDSEIIRMMSNSAIPEEQLQTTQQQTEPIQHPQQQQVTASLSTDGHDEGAMAVIMSLLEADASLGGPVDFAGLPWHLP